MDKQIDGWIGKWMDRYIVNCMDLMYVQIEIMQKYLNMYVYVCMRVFIRH